MVQVIFKSCWNNLRRGYVLLKNYFDLKLKIILCKIILCMLIVATLRTGIVRWSHAGRQLPLPCFTFVAKPFFPFSLCTRIWCVECLGTLLGRSIQQVSRARRLLRAAGGGGAPVAPHRRLNRPPPRNACALPIMKILLTHFYMIVHLDGGYPYMGLGETGSS